jgi:nucleoside-diphosphate-sugar epimerase
MPTPAPHRILVTGATGNLGRHVCRGLLERGHDVRATDRKFVADFPVPIELGDLLDEFFVHRVTQGCDSVVHLGNHPNRFAGPSDQRLLGENVAMNANVFCAAFNSNVECIVFASSVQVALKAAGSHLQPPLPIPYLPIDGDAPADPGTNPYGLSKEFAERMLRIQCSERPTLSATSLRFPMLPDPRWLERLRDPNGIPRRALNFGECITHLSLSDAGDLVSRVIERRLAGYHQYFPAVSAEITNLSLAALIGEMYSDIPLRQPREALTSLVDCSRLETDLDWAPTSELRVTLTD